MIEKRCSFTGNRYVKDSATVKIKLKQTLLYLIKNGYNSFFNGGAIGFDTLCALSVIELKNEYNIKLNMILPCEDQDEKWREAEKKVYSYILDNADSVRYITKEYTEGCMFERNRNLVDCCDVLVAYNTRTYGGTCYTVNYAKKAGKEIINIAEHM